MKRLILGILYCALWYVSILVGFFVFICPLLPLVFFHPRLYRKWSETVFGMWEPFPVALMEIFFGIRTVLTGDQIDPFERSLLIMNHRTRLDWNFLWVGLFHCCHPYSHAIKYVLKTSVMYLPGPGWVMQTCSFLFIHRNWAKDQRLLGRLIQYLDISDQPYQILIFPEGTDLTPRTLAKSHKYADERNLQRYHNVLHPKTTGFAFLANKMKLSGKFNAVYDITIGYPGKAPQSEIELLKGNFPEEIHFHVKRYSAREVPFGEPELRTWLTDVWRNKEDLLRSFNETGSFARPGNGSRDASNPPREPCGGSRGQRVAVGSPKAEDSDGSQEANGRRDSSSSVTGGDEPSTSSSGGLTADGESFVNRYRPSHLLYLTFIFWLVLIYITTHQLIVNFYVQMWVLIHTLFFSSISFLSEGFHHVIASVYFYRFNVKADARAKGS